MLNTEVLRQIRELEQRIHLLERRLNDVIAIVKNAPKPPQYSNITHHEASSPAPIKHVRDGY